MSNQRLYSAIILVLAFRGALAVRMSVHNLIGLSRNISAESLATKKQHLSSRHRFDCNFKGKPFKPELLCVRVSEFAQGEPDCGLSLSERKLSGSECKQYCTAMRNAVARAPGVPCENIQSVIDVLSRPSPFDCKYRGKPFEIQMACERAKNAYAEDPECGFSGRWSNFQGDCPALCTALRAAIANEPESPCGVIEWHLLANPTQETADNGDGEDRDDAEPVDVPPPLPQAPEQVVESPRKKPTKETSTLVPVPEVDDRLEGKVRFGCRNVWIVIEGDNSNGLNLRMGSDQWRRHFVEDLGWDIRCSYFLLNSGETKLNGEFFYCNRGAVCVESSRVEFSTLSRTIGSTFPRAQKVFLMFNDHGTKEYGLVFPGLKTLPRSLFLRQIEALLNLRGVQSLFVLVDACFSGSMFGDPDVRMMDADGRTVSIKNSHGGDNNTGVPDLLREVGTRTGKLVMGFASSIPPLSCMESGMRGGLFTWAYMNALDSIMKAHVDNDEDFSFRDIVETTWQQLPPVLPADEERITFTYIDPATRARRSHQQPHKIRDRAQTYFPMSFGNMVDSSAANFFCGTSACSLQFRNPVFTRCERGVNSRQACAALNDLPEDDSRGFAPIVKQCQWSDEHHVCLPWIKAHAYKGFNPGSSRFSRHDTNFPIKKCAECPP